MKPQGIRNKKKKAGENREARDYTGREAEKIRLAFKAVQSDRVEVSCVAEWNNAPCSAAGQPCERMSTTT